MDSVDNENKTKEQRILEAAIEIFAQKGYNGTTTKEIAQQAGVAEGTIFRYFPKKKDILHGILLKLIESFGPKILGSGLNEIFENTKNKSDKEVIIEFIKNRMNLVDTHLPLVKVIFNEAQYHTDIQSAYFDKIIPPIFKMINQFFENGIEQGRFKNQSPSVMTLTLLGCMASNMIGKKVLGNQRDMDKLLDESVEIFLNGISK